MKIRNATNKDLPAILAIYQRAREFMRSTGNPTQWSNAHPAPSLLTRDIESRNLYLLEDADGIQGVFALLLGNDPTYSFIEGSWPNDSPYVTIHRIASAGNKSGIVAHAVGYGLSLCPNLRIDTHHDNSVMQHVLEKLGFQRCGIIYLENGDPRIAYQIIK